MSVTTSSDTTEKVTDASTARPRIRSGAIAWGLIVCVLSAFVLAVISHPGRRAEFVDWAVNLGPGGQGLALLLSLGCLILLLALLSLIRNAQRRRG